ncbi:MAG: hypothetical protein GY849_04145 [Deltaproteobacteria bacterium]|nr:hypothetical protein [Deltaproteobacteria bacterium]
MGFGGALGPVLSVVGPTDISSLRAQVAACSTQERVGGLGPPETMRGQDVQAVIPSAPCYDTAGHDLLSGHHAPLALLKEAGTEPRLRMLCLNAVGVLLQQEGAAAVRLLLNQHPLLSALEAGLSVSPSGAHTAVLTSGRRGSGLCQHPHLSALDAGLSVNPSGAHTALATNRRRIRYDLMPTLLAEFGGGYLPCPALFTLSINGELLF